MDFRKNITIKNLCGTFYELPTQLKVSGFDEFCFEKTCLRNERWVYNLANGILNNEIMVRRVQVLECHGLSTLDKFLDFEWFCFNCPLTMENWPIRHLITLAKLIIIYKAHLLFYSLPENLSKEPFFDGVNLNFY